MCARRKKRRKGKGEGKKGAGERVVEGDEEKGNVARTERVQDLCPSE